MPNLNLNISSSYDEVVLVNKSIREFLDKEGVERHISNAFEICITEALSNVIKHAYMGEKGNIIDVRLEKDSNIIELEIIDEGKTRTSIEIPDLNYDPQDVNNLPESGMGLYIIKQLMDEIDYVSRNGKNYFTLRKWIY